MVYQYKSHLYFQEKKYIGTKHISSPRLALVSVSGTPYLEVQCPRTFFTLIHLVFSDNRVPSHLFKDTYCTLIS